MATTEIPLVENVRKANDEIAAENRSELDALGVRAVNLMGAPGCGKTAWLERTLEALRGELAVGVVTGDLATARDAERLVAFTPHVAQINTGRGCHLEAHQVRRGMAHLPLAELDLLVIENVGNLICPVAWDLGQHHRVGMFSLPEGDDKPAKHPWLVLSADLLLLTKTDLAPYVPFDVRRFHRDLQEMREEVPVLEVSATTGEGLETWLRWLRELVEAP
jgi:hydrogenase nickel incorporation protein HypB